MKVTHTLVSSGLVMYPPLRRGLSTISSTQTLMNLAWLECHDLVSISTYLPSLLPMSFPMSSDICSNGNPQIWTQKGECVNSMFSAVSPLFHCRRSSRLLSKFQGPFFSTHSIWYWDLNLNWRMPLPTSMILRSEPIFRTDLSVLLKARWFGCLLTCSLPKRLNAHSSKMSGLLWFVIWMSSSSSLVNCRFWRLSSIVCSILGYWGLAT